MTEEIPPLPFEPGIYRGIPAAVYHAAPFISNSGLKKFRKDGSKKYKHERDNPPAEEETTPAKIQGKLFHYATFEPELFGAGVSHYIRPATYPAPAANKKVKAGVLKAGDPIRWNGNATYCKDWLEEHSELPIITQEQEDNLRGAAQALMDDEFVGEMLRAHKNSREVTVLARHPRTGLELKMRADLLTEDAGGRPWVLDAKSIDDLDMFPRHARDFGYDTQDVYYTDMLELVGVENAGFVFAVVELTPPFEIRVETIDAESQDEARALYQSDLDKLAECEKSGVWPRKYPGIGKLRIPRRFINGREEAFA